MATRFHFNIPVFKLQKRKLYRWIFLCLNYYHRKSGDINIIFVSKNEITRLNTKYLDHNYSTDVISFPYNTSAIISGDIYICVEQVKENALYYSVDFNNELNRVIIHGILHLLEFKDNTPRLKKEMRILEDFWLDKL